MPPRWVEPIARNVILYYYAKLVIAPSSGLAGNYGFINDRYLALADGRIRMSDYDRELERLAADTSCVFCGNVGVHIVSLVRRDPRFQATLGIQNKVRACAECERSREEKDLVAWWEATGRDLNDLPRVPAGLYLKIAYHVREVTGRLRERCRDLREVMPAELRGA
jgi:hypothetical protein